MRFLRCFFSKVLEIVFSTLVYFGYNLPPTLAGDNVFSDNWEVNGDAHWNIQINKSKFDYRIECMRSNTKFRYSFWNNNCICIVFRNQKIWENMYVSYFEMYLISKFFDYLWYEYFGEFKFSEKSERQNQDAEMAVLPVW